LSGKQFPEFILIVLPSVAVTVELLLYPWIGVSQPVVAAAEIAGQPCGSRSTEAAEENLLFVGAAIRRWSWKW